MRTTGNAYLDAARAFADTALDRGRDRYGNRETPLFVDGLHVETLEPVQWQGRGETWVLCNVASQQPLMRLLDGLTAVTGDGRLPRCGEDATRLRHGAFAVAERSALLGRASRLGPERRAAGWAIRQRPRAEEPSTLLRADVAPFVRKPRARCWRASGRPTSSTGRPWTTIGTRIRTDRADRSGTRRSEKRSKCPSRRRAAIFPL